MAFHASPHLYVLKPSPSSSAGVGGNPCSPFTFFMELPVAVHLPLSLGPVATVSPETCFPHSYYCSSWGRTEKRGGEGKGEGCGFS